MPKNSLWSSREIELLKNGFSEGKPFKELSQELGRSTTALNKALARFHIRPYNRKKDLDFPSFFSAEQARKCGFKSSKRRFSEKQLYASTGEIIQFLKNNGYNVRSKNFNKDCLYFVNQHPVSFFRLLVMANSLRLERNLPIFLMNEPQS
jgi:hypothetical protein